MQKPLILGVSFLALSLGAYFLYRFVTTPQSRPADNGEATPEIVDETFRPDFLNGMDTDGDKRITWSEFEVAYNAENSSKLTVGKDKKQLTAEQAFNFCDVNNDKVIDLVDRRALDKGAWPAFRTEALDKGLGPIVWEGKWLALNSHQAAWLDRERGAVAQGTLPFRGQYFKRSYFGRWVKVIEKAGKATEGFASFDDSRPGKLFLLRDDGQIRVFNRDRVDVINVPEHPSIIFYRAVSSLGGRLSTVEINLKIAADCERGGLSQEAITMYRRVLIFDRANAKALAALKLRLSGDNYLPADG